jgi:ribosomal protein L29
MKKTITELTGKSVAELEKDIQTIRSEITKAQLDYAIAAAKDSNIVPKKKKQLARIETVLSQKRGETKK